MPDPSPFDAQLQRLREVREEEIRQQEQTIAELKKQVAQYATRCEEVEKTAQVRFITLDTILTDPAIGTREDNAIRYVNTCYVKTTGYVDEDVVGKPVTTYVRGLEFLLQLRDDPELAIVENWKSLDDIPVALLMKDGNERLMGANVKFVRGGMAGYSGVTIIFKSRDEPSLLQRAGTYLLSGGGLLNRYEMIRAGRYAEEGIITLPESENVQQDQLTAGQRFLQDVTKAILQRTAPRGVVVKFQGVTSCSPKIYDAFRSIAVISDFPFTLIVEDDSAVLQGLREHRFPEEKLKILKKKNKEKKEK